MSFDYSVYSNLTLDELQSATEDYMNELVEKGYLSFFQFRLPSEIQKEILEEEGHGTDLISYIYANAYKNYLEEGEGALISLRDQILKNSKCLILLNREYEVP